MLVGCVVRAVFIVKLNDFAKEHDAVAISVNISMFVAVFSFIIWFAIQPSTFAALPWSGTIVASLFIYAYFIIAFAQTLNIFAQKRATAAGNGDLFDRDRVLAAVGRRAAGNAG